jgi:hypothetical protein
MKIRSRSIAHTPRLQAILLTGLALPMQQPPPGPLPVQAVGPAGDLAAAVEITVQGQADPAAELTWMLVPPELQIVDASLLGWGQVPEVEFMLIYSAVVPGAWMPEWVRYNLSVEDLGDPAIGPCNTLAQNPPPAQAEPRLSQGWSSFSLRVNSAGQLQPLPQPRKMGFRRCDHPPLLEITFQNPS